MRFLRHLAAPGLAALVGVSTSCTYSLELKRFHHKADTTPIGGVTFTDFRFTAKAMRPHIDEYFELLVLDRSDVLQLKAIYNKVIVEDFSFFLKAAIPKMSPPYRIDYWADHNLSGKYDGIVGGINEKDHAWRRILADPLPEDVRIVDSRYELTFQHDTAFVDIRTDLQGNPISGAESLLPCHLSVANAGAFAGKMMELRVTDHATGRLTGFYRQGSATADFPALITGILDEETPYDIAVYVDQNGNERYDPGEPSWATSVVSTSIGVELVLDLSSLPMGAIDTGEP